jgi:DNA-binding transcriptional MerR regulator
LPHRRESATVARPDAIAPSRTSSHRAWIVVDKAPDAYRTISEVADDLDLPQHVLRFWETRFGQIRPLKRGGGRRYYRPEDIDLLKGIRHLLYGEGYTIRGVQRIIKESGVKAIQALGRGEGAAALQKPKGPDIIGPAPDDEDEADADGTLVLARPAMPAFAPAAYGEPPFTAPRSAAVPDDDDDDDGREPVTAPPVHREPVPREAAPREPVHVEPVFTRPPAPEEPEARRPTPMVEAPRPAPVVRPPQAESPAVRAVPDMPSMRPAAPGMPAAAPPAVARLAADDVRRLQAALYELLECRKRLDTAFDGR